VTELNSSGGLIGFFNPSGLIGGPQGVTAEASGNVWMDNGGSVIELSSNGDLAGNYDPADANISGAVSIAIDAGGNAWIANSSGNSVTELTSTGVLIGNFAPSGANFNGPYFVAIDGSGDA